MEEKIVQAHITGKGIARSVYCVSGMWTAVGALTAVFAVPFHPAGVFCTVFSFSLAAIGFLVGGFLHWMMDRCELTITNRRIVGKAGFGRMVDLPLAQISAVTIGRGSRVSILTSGGRLHFWLIKNRAEVCTALNQLIGGDFYRQLQTQQHGPRRVSRHL